MRRLTIGPKVIARVVNVDGNVARVEVAEINWVPITLYEYTVNAERSYKRAEFVSYYIWKVPKSKTLSYRGVFGRPVVLNGCSKSVEIPLPSDNTSFGERILGTSQSVEIRIKGYDEIGRGVVERIGYK